MAFVLTAAGTFGILSAAATLALGIVILARRPQRLLNRAAAAVLFVDSGILFLTNGVLYLTDSVPTAFAAQITGGVVGCGWLVAYPFLLSALDSPLSGWLRWRTTRIALAALALFAASWFVVDGASMVDGPHPTSYAPLDFTPLGPFVLLSTIPIVLSLYGIATAVTALRRAATPEARTQAKWFIVSFGVRDGLLALYFTAFSLGAFWIGAFGGTVVLAYASVMTYTVLRGQLFDIDRRIKVGLERSTIAAIFAVAYFVASETAEALLTPRWGIALGLAAAGILVVAIVPLQKLAERVAGRVVPDATPDALAERKLEVYRNELTAAYASGDGRILPRDAAFLERLRASLGLTERDHAILDHAVRFAGRPAPSGIALVESLGRFRVERRLGAGSFGQAFLAHDERLGRRVVVKVIESGDMEAVLREARALAKVLHPNVVALFDAEKVGQAGFLVMEYVEGETLRERLDRGRVEEPEFSRVADGLLAGLDAVHRAGLVHRDIKPQNVLVATSGQAKLADFGIAQVAGLDATIGVGGKALPSGTARYMSPEQARGRRATPSSDLYGAGAVLFEAWVGSPYHQASATETGEEVLVRVARGSAFIAPPDMAPPLAAWFARALAPEPADRFASAAQMREELPAALRQPV